MLLQNRFGVQIVNMFAFLATVDLRLAFARHSKQMGLCHGRLAPVTLQPLRMKMFQDPFFALFLTE